MPVACLLVGLAAGTDMPVRFQLKCDPQAVALQFDVSSTESVSLESPSFQGASPHVVESAVLGSTGAKRFVIYTTTGLPISAGGSILVTFSANGLSDGMLQIINVMASNAGGNQLAASPNGLPVILSSEKTYQSAQVGVGVPVTVSAYDLDGSLAAVEFKESGTAFSQAFTFQPATAIWTPGASGTYNLSASAADVLGGESEVGIGTIRAYQPGDLATFSDFESIHFGPAADPADLGFDTGPFGHGIANGLAWLLGINPNSPDRSRLPWGSVERNGSGDDFVFRFNRLASFPGAGWDVLESPDLSGPSWDPVPGAWVTETPLGDGTVDVEIRKPIDPATEPKAFLTLEATEAP